MLEPQLDVRAIRMPEKHPRIFERFDALGVGESFVLINNHDPKHLRDEFEIDHPGEFGWEYMQRGPERWEIRITRLASAPLPQILCDAWDIAERSVRTGRLGCGLEASAESTPPRCQHHPSAAGFPNRSACWPRSRCPVAHPARLRPADDRSQHTGAAPWENALAASPLSARNRSRR